MKRNLLTALIAIITTCYVTLPSHAKTSYISTVNAKDYSLYALNSRGVTSELGLRTYFGRYMVVVGNNVEASYGDYIDLAMSTGRTIPCVVLDKRGVADSYDSGDVAFVIDEDKVFGDMRRYKTVTANERFAGSINEIHIYTGTDYAGIKFNRYENNSDTAHKRLVIKKNSMIINGKEFFFVYYADNGNINVKQITEERYKSIKVDWSVINV